LLALEVVGRLHFDQAAAASPLEIEALVLQVFFQHTARQRILRQDIREGVKPRVGSRLSLSVAALGEDLLLGELLVANGYGVDIPGPLREGDAVEGSFDL